jgi:hypothetical protein
MKLANPIFCSPPPPQGEKMECVPFSTTHGLQTQRAVIVMKQNKLIWMLAVLLTTTFWACVATAQQAKPTASRALELSTFGGVSADYTGLSGGRNGSLSVGVDLAFAPYRGLRPTVELRGLYPLDKGTIVSQKAGFGGLRVDFLLGHRAHPYGDFLFGRGQMNYGTSGYLYNDYNYLVTTTYVYSPGAGVDLDLTRRLAIKLDGQYQSWGDTPTASTTVHSTIATVGLVYRFGQRGVF